MKSSSSIFAVSVVAFAIGGCASNPEPKKEAGVKFMTAKEVGKAFAKGSKECSWKSGKKGSDRGTDFYYKDISATSGNADRILGDTTFQGTWSISGDTLSLNFGVGEPQNYKLVKVGKNSYTAYLDGKKKKMTFKCR